MLKAWSRTQALIALSSGESELAAVTKAAAEALGIKSVLADFGVTVKIEIHSDATAAIGICKRQGSGRVRHLATADLWVQQRVRSRDLKLYKLPGKENPTDLMTKHKSAPKPASLFPCWALRVLPEGLSWLLQEFLREPTCTMTTTTKEASILFESLLTTLVVVVVASLVIPRAAARAAE